MNSDSKLKNFIPDSKHLQGYNLNKEAFYDIIGDCRATKTEEEIDVMRWATKITVEGHKEVLKACKPGLKES